MTPSLPPRSTRQTARDRGTTLRVPSRESSMVGSLARLAFVFAALALAVPDSLAHDSWISRGGHRNAAGEWCCGTGDCFVIPAEQVTMTGDGYILFGAERIPFNEAQPS